MNQVMKTVCVLAGAALLSGCLNLYDEQGAEVVTHNAQLAPNAEYLSAAAVETPDDGQSDSAVESALHWSNRYSETVEKLMVMQDECRQLTDANRLKSQENAKLQLELTQCRVELKAANEMLLEMRAELDKWKSNVLGFRQEMRQAQETQLTALRRVLKLLGAEVSEQAPITASVNEGNTP